MEERKGIPDDVGSLGPEVSALLIDLRAESGTELTGLMKNTRQAVNRFKVVREPEIPTASTPSGMCAAGSSPLWEACADRNQRDH